MLALESLTQVLQADQERDDSQDPHNPRTQHDRHFGGVRDRQDRESSGHEHTQHDGTAPHARVAALEAGGTRRHRTLEALMVSQGRHNLSQAVAVGGHTRRLGHEQARGR